MRLSARPEAELRPRYRGAAYSDGAVEEMAGGKYQCTKDGTWAYVGPKDEPLPEESAN